MAVKDVIDQIESDINKVNEMDKELDVLLQFSKDAGEDITQVEADTRRNRLRLKRFNEALANTKKRLGG